MLDCSTPLYGICSRDLLQHSASLLLSLWRRLPWLPSPVIPQFLRSSSPWKLFQNCCYHALTCLSTLLRVAPLQPVLEMSDYQFALAVSLNSVDRLPFPWISTLLQIMTTGISQKPQYSQLFYQQRNP
ncbi:hypothetical protein CHARACLAT_002010 [Characodon lateralis]|uniref:Uncharacterized protein n=1 Tax=Characodon lateralis TaxID=208331 RepID=A0ABU7DH32_9TELE|nr:hypothetical protein [Characodon lateralis]